MTPQKITRSTMKRTCNIGMLSIFLATASCGSSATQAFISQLETDLLNGTALTALEQLVVRYFPNLAGDAIAIASVLQAGISLLQSAGLLPTTAAVNAAKIQEQIRAKLAPAKVSTNKDVLRIVAEIRGERPATIQTAAFISALRHSF